ncbi:MAG TPA: HEPN domain-containing protein [Candidatus Nanoarchaeia archaeon]|nr:HEPN domain-containing protein [Candidatus Nanoarchaeia archaeon]
MVTLKWCCGKKEGIQLIEPNENLAKGYIEMSEAAIGTMNRERNINMQFAISACYYSMYYSLYAILMKIGVKCEIHTCTLEFMKKLLTNFYSKEDFKIINKAFNVRNTSQYYIDKIVSKEDIDFIMSNAPYFLSKSKEILSKINEKDVKEIRTEIEKLIN